jgi:hypothetical protein
MKRFETYLRFRKSINKREGRTKEEGDEEN